MDLTKSSRSLIVQLDETEPQHSHHLRRKKSFYRVSAPAAQSPVIAEVEMAIDIPPMRPQSMMALQPKASSVISHNRSQSQPNTLRLGHPRRPYYSAIRPGMSTSRPSSPPNSYSPPTAVDDSMDVDDGPPVAPAISPRRSSFRLGFGAYAQQSSGFSVTGEMEMRMALAAIAREEEARQTDSDSRPHHQHHHHLGKGSVGRQVKKLRKGLRDLVRRKPS
ncbi:hypothetical protein MIND_00507400 [Mycena indigotica]|uniref:Uncharacterized protein n=1 Tax=Mycena indigotica TaxID=2126181 RepID=A0A8H6SXV4_9AGAR|nr:uncharacterized protein MIND_00507400 [Mycena indigotica]KAF7307140.1 hypothetical protein MIND_00507400 [Mycena indigotica]